MGILDFFFRPDVPEIEKGHNVRRLIRALRYRRDWTVQTKAAEALGRLKDPRSVTPLIAALKDKKIEVQCAAARALGDIKDPRAVEALIELMKDNPSDEYVQRAAVDALAKIGDSRGIKPIMQCTRIKVEDLIAALARFNDPQVINRLMHAARDKYASLSIKAKAVVGLKKYHDRSVTKVIDKTIEEIIASLQSKDGAAREQAAQALYIVADARSVKPLIAALKDRNGSVHRWAASALGEICDVAAVEPLVEAFRSGSDAAASALGKIGDVRAIEPLAKELLEIAKSTDAYERKRLRAVSCLGQFGPAAAVARDGLIELLEDKTPFRRYYGGGEPIFGEFGVVGTTEVEGYTIEYEIPEKAANALGMIFKGTSDPVVVRALLAKHNLGWAKLALERITGLNFIDRFEESKRDWLKKDPCKSASA